MGGFPALAQSETPLTGGRNEMPSGGVTTPVVGRPLDEEELVARARRGDSAAYEELVRQHQETAFRTAYLVTGSRSEAEEAAHDAFVKAFGALRRFDPSRPFRPWLLAIVVNESRNRRRSAARRGALADRFAQGLRSGDATPSPEAAVLAAERRAALVAAVRDLPDDQRLAVACRYFLDLSEAETAAVLRVRPGTVKSRLSRALDRLREEVGEGV